MIDTAEGSSTFGRVCRGGGRSALLLLALTVLARVASGQNLSDLYVSDISFSSIPIPGVPTIATARLTNIGTRFSGAFYIKWFVDGVEVGYVDTARWPLVRSRPATSATPGCRSRVSIVCASTGALALNPAPVSPHPNHFGPALSTAFCWA